MSDDLIKMISSINFSYGFIYECTNLINNLYDHNNYYHLAIKLYSNFVLPIINITKDEHIKEYNEHVKNNKYINRNCSYLMNICSEKYFKLSKDEYSKIKEFIDNNIDTFESIHPCITLLIYIENVIIIIVIAYVVVIVKKIIINVFVLLMNIVNFVKKIIF